jgi:hypothetical protein
MYAQLWNIHVRSVVKHSCTLSCETFMYAQLWNIHVRSVVKQVCTTCNSHNRDHFLERTSTGYIWEILVVNQIGLKSIVPGLRGRHLDDQATVPLQSSQFIIYVYLSHDCNLIIQFFSFQDNCNDYFCWLCHKEGMLVCCELCPRVYHTRCLGLSAELPQDWVCPECEVRAII